MISDKAVPQNKKVQKVISEVGCRVSLSLSRHSPSAIDKTGNIQI